MTQTIKLTDIAQIENIYRTRMREDFAPDELKPLNVIVQAWEKGIYDCYILTRQETILGYAYFVRKDSNYIVDYLAISAEHRDEGWGTVFLKQLAEFFHEANCVVVEVEDPDVSKDEEDKLQRERRLRFYIRNGFRLTGVKARVFGVDYLILEALIGTEHKSEEIAKIYAELYHSILHGATFKTRFMILGNE